LNKHISEQAIPPTSHDRSVTPEFSELVLHMLKKKPADRPQNLHEFLSRFSRIRVYLTDPPPQQPQL
jgi:hypothetical protein